MIVRADSMRLSLIEYQGVVLPDLKVNYCPVSRAAEGDAVQLYAYQGTFKRELPTLPQALQRKLKHFEDALIAAAVPVLEIPRGGRTIRSAPGITAWSLRPWLKSGSTESNPYSNLNRYIEFQYRVALRDSTYGGNEQLDAEAVPASMQRLIDNFLPSLEQLAWRELLTKVEGAESVAEKPKEVFISYRFGREAFAQAMADRLGAAGFIPWFDRWEIKVGDSIVRGMQKGLRDADAIILVLTPDYREGKWATEEMEAAIVRRIQKNTRVIPVMYEKCEVPELLQALRFVDCTDHRPEIFEAQFAEVIDALNEIELNPYR